MKINKFIALAAIAIMAIGAMGFVSSKTYATGARTHLPHKHR